MARIHDYPLQIVKDRGLNLIKDWPSTSLKIAPKLRHTSVNDLVAFGKNLVKKQGQIKTKLTAIKTEAIGKSLGSGIMERRIASGTTLNVHEKRLANVFISPQVVAQLNLYTLSIHERQDPQGRYFLALVLHKPYGQKEVLMDSTM